RTSRRSSRASSTSSSHTTCSSPSEGGPPRGGLAGSARQQDTAGVHHVPKSVQRLVVEIEGWLELGAAQRALDKMERLLAVPGARPAALVLRTRAHIALGDFAAALLDIGELRAFDHDADWADTTAARCHRQMGDLAAAADCMESMIRRSRRSAVGHFRLGCYLALKGECQRAIDEISLACGLD